MAIITNTFTKYNVVGLREDLNNLIANISPEETPFVTNITKRRNVTNTFFEFQTDSLSSAAANAHIDGDDLGTSFTAITPTVRLGNYTQILRKDFIVADNLAGSLDTAGRRSEIAYQLAKHGKELRRDQEMNLVGVNQAAVAGNNTTARKTASLSAFIKTNTSKGTGGADPTVSSGVNAARTDGTQRAISEAMLKDVIQSTWTEGGSPTMLMVGAFNKRAISAFAGIAAQRYMAPSDGPTQIVGAADVYQSDFGSISIIPNRFSRSRDAYLLDPDLIEIAQLRPMQSTELSKTGDATKYMMLMEMGLQVNQEAGLGIIADLTTS